MLLFSVLKTLVQFDDVTAMTCALSTWALTCEGQRKAQKCVCVRVYVCTHCWSSSSLSLFLSSSKCVVIKSLCVYI